MIELRWDRTLSLPGVQYCVGCVAFSRKSFWKIFFEGSLGKPYTPYMATQPHRSRSTRPLGLVASLEGNCGTGILLPCKTL